jgi:hypothetical protein
VLATLLADLLSRSQLIALMYQSGHSAEHSQAEHVAIVEALAREVAAAVETLRSLDLYKPPGVAVTIDWATALGRLGVSRLDDTAVSTTLGTVLKYREDAQRVMDLGIGTLLDRSRARAGS